MKQELLKYLGGPCPWQDSLIWFDTIDSTNTRAKAMAAQGAPEGTVLMADTQTGGRGRRGRSFHSPAGTGIYMSLILRPKCRPGELMHLTCAAAVAACDAIEAACGFRPGIKWTNDLVWQGKKLAGILTELGINGQGALDYAVVGIGINCCQQEGDFPEEIRHMAGSLASVSGKTVDRARVAAAMIEALWEMNDGLLSGHENLMDRYRADCVTLGREVSVLKADGSVRHGTALDVDADGGLTVCFETGETATVSSGEVSVRGMYGYL